MYKYFTILLVVSLFASCSKDCDQEFFFIDLKPEYSITSECIQKGQPFTFSLEYTDTLDAFSGVVITEFDTVMQGTDTIVVSENIPEINLVDIKGYNFTTSITFHRLNDSVSNIESHSLALADFKIETTGIETSDNFDPGFFRSFDPIRANSVSNLELTITPLDTGSFYMSVVHGNAGVFEDPIIADGCDDLILASYANGGAVNEGVLWAATRDSSYLSMDDLESLTQTKAMIFFKVVDDINGECL